MVNFKTDDGVVHAQAPARDGRNFDATACGLMLYGNIYYTPLSIERHAVSTDERTTCLLCIGA